MIELEPRRIGEHRFQVGRGEIAAGRKPHEMLVAPAVADLQQAQPVTRGYQTHGFGIDRNRAGGENSGGEIVFVKVDSHGQGA